MKCASHETTACAQRPLHHEPMRSWYLAAHRPRRRVNISGVSSACIRTFKTIEIILRCKASNRFAAVSWYGHRVIRYAVTRKTNVCRRFSLSSNEKGFRHCAPTFAQKAFQACLTVRSKHAAMEPSGVCARFSQFKFPVPDFIVNQFARIPAPMISS